VTVGGCWACGRDQTGLTLGVRVWLASIEPGQVDPRTGRSVETLVDFASARHRMDSVLFDAAADISERLLLAEVTRDGAFTVLGLRLLAWMRKFDCFDADDLFLCPVVCLIEHGKWRGRAG
jgi:hypothetical protein